MRTVTFSMTMSLDGFIVDPEGSIDWSAPDDEIFRSHIEEIRSVGVHLLGRRLYETMLYWEDPEVAHSFSEDEREWASLWNPLPKVVFSNTLAEVQGSARLATGSIADEIQRLRAEPGDGEIAIGGATLAAAAADADLIDEYRVRIYPVLLGGGIPFFARDEKKVDLELLETRVFGSGVVYLRHRVRH